MLSADSKDYARICAEFGVGDLDHILKKLEQKRREQAQNKNMVGKLSALKVAGSSPAIVISVDIKMLQNTASFVMSG